LEFTDDPDYVYLNRLIKSIIRREYPDTKMEDLNNNLESFQYDWNLLSGKEEELSLDNIKFFKENIPGLLEVSIGHALISEALYLGLDNVVNMYLNKLK
jgi:pyridoxine 5'-phosphate synthase PdxJ